LNRPIRCVCGKKIGPDPRNFNQRVSLGRNDLLIRTFLSQPWYDTVDKQASIAYQGMAMMSVLSVVSQTHLVAIAPRWLAEEFAESLELQVLPLPLKQNSRTCYLSWHEAAGRDKGHQWMEEQLVSICKR
ncbi:hypothetical protein OFS94_12120, partial [Escherichia coli]|nr:hypothetical protein [Escherichia coli]